MIDAIIIGAGPAGISAGIYLARAGKSVLVMEQKAVGGLINITEKVENYPGVGEVKGYELSQNMRKQSEEFGVKFSMEQVIEIKENGLSKLVKTNKGETECLGIVLAMGAKPREIGFKGEEQFKGKGISYCATCDGRFFKGKEVYVIGGGLSACQESLFLAEIANNVKIVVRKPQLSVPETIEDKVKNNPKIKIMFNTYIKEAGGENRVQYAVFYNTETDKEFKIEAPPDSGLGIFVFAGYEPDNALAKNLIKLNENGYIITNENRETNVPGIVAAGDIVEKQLRQITTAVADGSVAGTSLSEYITRLREKINQASN